MNQLRGWIAAATESITTVVASPGSATNIGSFDGVAALKAVGVTPTLYKRCKVCDAPVVSPLRKYCSQSCHNFYFNPPCPTCEGSRSRISYPCIDCRLSRTYSPGTSRDTVDLMVARRYFCDGLTLRQIGVEIDRTPETVRQKIARVLRKPPLIHLRMKATNLRTIDRAPIIEYLNALHHPK